MCAMKRSIVIDNGSYQLKAGFSGDDAPRSVFPPTVGTSKGGRDPYIGDEAHVKQSVLSPSQRTIENGTVNNWSEMEMIIRHALYNELRIDPADFRVLMANGNERDDRHRMSELLFESFNVREVYLATQATLATFGNGQLSSLVFDSGADCTTVTPVFAGCPLYHGMSKMGTGGRDIIRRVKEKYRTALLDNQAIDRIIDYHYGIKTDPIVLPDETTVKGDDNVIVNYMFDEKPHQLITDSIDACDVDLVDTFTNNILIVGGNAYLRGFTKRLQGHFTQDIIIPPERKYLAWLGGSILASVELFNDWVTKADYEEYGMCVTRRKFIA